jgi:hypothetical protein
MTTRAVGTHTASRAASNLTVGDLQRLYDAVKSVFYVHPDDLEQPLVKKCRDNGYEIISRESMVAGKAFIQNASKCGVVDFEKGEAYLGKNVLIDWIMPKFEVDAEASRG